MHEYLSRFEIRDRVTIDGDDKLIVHVTAVLWRNEKPTVEVSWFSDGQSRSAWVEEWRLEVHDA